MDHKLNILLVEEDSALSNFLMKSLLLSGYHVMKASTGKEALAIATSNCSDLMLLSLDLPDMDGLEVINSLRQISDLPIIALSARTRERDKVRAFDLGADDYVTKPLGISELLARMRAILKRSMKINTKELDEAFQFQAKGLFMDMERRIVKAEGKNVHLTPIEYKILSILVRNAGKVLTYAFIMKEVWGPYTNEKHTLRVNVANIRKKIEVDIHKPKIIHTIVGVGYRMVEE